MNKLEDPELLESPSLRTFIIAIQSRLGLPKPLQTVVVVKAYNIPQAKVKAIAKICKNPAYKNRRELCMWVFNSIEEGVE